MKGMEKRPLLKIHGIQNGVMMCLHPSFAVLKVITKSIKHLPQAEKRNPKENQFSA